MADDQQPTNPFESSDPMPHTIDGNGNGNGDEALSAGTPGVAAKAGKTYVAFGVLGVVVFALLYNLFSGPKKPEAVVDEPKKVVIEQKPKEPPPIPTPVEEPPKPVTNAELPPLPAPNAIPLPDPVTVPVPEALSPINDKENAAAKQQALARMKSSMMVKDGGSSAAGGADVKTPTVTAAPTDPNSQFLAANSPTKTETAKATKITNLRRTIAQGRIIQATLESAINTDLPAPIRAIVSVDTYGEAGTEPLIPKGSRLVGTYNTTLNNGQTRVFVVWTRVIRPDGVDVQLGSPLVDSIGMAGVAGQLDTKFQEIFARSLVSSLMNIATAIGTDKISGGSTTTTTSTTGSQTSGDAVTTATTNALNRLGATTDSFIQRFISVPPTILVDQGSKVNVMVNKDLYFPEDTAGVRIIN